MQYGLIGKTLGHSFSKEIHSLIAPYDYSLKEIAPENLESFILGKEYLGLNVTIPYKESVIPFLDEVSPIAKKIGAVNTVVNKNGKLCGFNTDYFGAKALIEKNGIVISGKKVIVLGTGGTSKTFSQVLSDLGAEKIINLSRTPDKNSISYEEGVKCHFDASVIVNTTPVGMHPNDQNQPIDISAFKNLQAVIDVIYNPLRTRLIESAKKRKIKAVNGLYMLCAQAVKASSLFIGVDFSQSKIDEVYNKTLNLKRNIVLIGMPSCGKTSVGKALAKKLCLDFVDTDEMIESANKKTVTDIFSEGGESAFRDLESIAVREASLKTGRVIATGGGAILREVNLENLRKNGIIVFINRALENLITTTSRPLSSNKSELEKRFNERFTIYKNSCDIEVDGNDLLDKVAEKIIMRLENEDISY